MSKIKIGILAVQGDVTENFLATMASMSELGIDGSGGEFLFMPGGGSLNKTSEKTLKNFLNKNGI